MSTSVFLRDLDLVGICVQDHIEVIAEGLPVAIGHRHHSHLSSLRRRGTSQTVGVSSGLWRLRCWIVGATREQTAPPRRMLKFWLISAGRHELRGSPGFCFDTFSFAPCRF